MSLRYVSIAQMGNGEEESANDVTHRKRTRRILGDLKKSVELRLDTGREGSTFGARRGQTNLCATGAAQDGGG